MQTTPPGFKHRPFRPRQEPAFDKIHDVAIDEESILEEYIPQPNSLKKGVKVDRQRRGE